MCTPAHLANIATKIAALAPERFELKVLLRPEVEALKMGLYLGGGSARPELNFTHTLYEFPFQDTDSSNGHLCAC